LFICAGNVFAPGTEVNRRSGYLLMKVELALLWGRPRSALPTCLSQFQTPKDLLGMHASGKGVGVIQLNPTSPLLNYGALCGGVMIAEQRNFPEI
jgi:hypothetical protein